MPDTFMQGLLAGLLQPLMGIAYLGAFVAVGLTSAAQMRGVLIGLLFPAGLLLGAFLQMAERVIPGANALIAFSVLALGALLLPAKPVRGGIAGTVLAVAGVLIGYGLTSFATGAQDPALYGYLAGMVLTQLVISYGAMLLAQYVRAKIWFQPVWMRLLGAIVVGIGLTLFVDQLTGVTPQGEEEEETAPVSQLKERDYLKTTAAAAARDPRAGACPIPS
jgi:urease accessory protein